MQWNIWNTCRTCQPTLQQQRSRLILAKMIRKYIVEVRWTCEFETVCVCVLHLSSEWKPSKGVVKYRLKFEYRSKSCYSKRYYPRTCFDIPSPHIHPMRSSHNANLHTAIEALCNCSSYCCFQVYGILLGLTHTGAALYLGEVVLFCSQETLLCIPATAHRFGFAARDNMRKFQLSAG